MGGLTGTWLVIIAAAASPYHLEGRAVVGAGTRLALPCTPKALLQNGGQLYVACGAAGLATVKVAPGGALSLVGVEPVGGEAVGLHVAAGRVWVEIDRLEARPVAELAGGAAPVEQAPPMKAPGGAAPATETGPAVSGPQGRVTPGHVVQSRDGEVVIDIGKNQGLAAGDHIELFTTRQVLLAGGETAAKERRLAVGVVGSVSASHATVELGRNERVGVGARVRLTTAPLTASRLAPPRAAGLWSVRFALRPFLGVNTLAFGSVSDAAVGYRFDQDVHLQLVLEPLGLALAKKGNLLASAGTVFASYDTAIFEIGLGVGWSAVNNDLNSSSSLAARAPGGITPQVTNVQYGVAIGQVARLGAADGLHLEARNTFILYKSEFHYGGTVGVGMAPVGSRSWLVLQGGGGASGYAYGELGLRFLMTGSGLHGSVFGTASLGGAGLFGEVAVGSNHCLQYSGGDYYLGTNGTCYTKVSYAGPMVGFSIEWRP